ncbi:hypothetical protein BHM03_00005418 [Ensete ventricosum]|nr:hypothetical protein BHM03_00005418 [Ensete ventricosum]
MLQVKGLSKEELATRNDLVLALPDRIQSIPDGSTNGSKQTGSWTASRTEIRFDSTSGYPTHFGIFLQDQGLNIISEGLETLKNMAHDMNEVVDKATSDLKNTNVRLKQTLDQVHFTTINEMCRKLVFYSDLQADCSSIPHKQIMAMCPLLLLLFTLFAFLL